MPATPADLAALGKHLKTVRTNAGLSRAELAARLAVHPSSVTQWENGVNTPRLRHVFALREILGESTLYTETAAA